MRIRFFITILTVLFLVSLAVVAIYGSLLKGERLAFIDQQVRETASVLVDSELGDLRKFNIEQADDIISEELGEGRVGKFFIVRNSKGEILFESSSAKVLPLKEIPRGDRWVTLNTKESYIRVLNLELPRIKDRTLQVGIVIGREIIHPNYLSTSTAILLLSVLGVGLVASFILTSFLLNPISKFADFILDSSNKLRSEQQLTNIPTNFGRGKYFDLSLVDKHDEYQKLIKGFNVLIERVNRFNRNSKLWAYQMAHELKTPLTLIGLESESLLSIQSAREQGPKVLSIQKELSKVSETISSFLNWAELENSNGSKHLFANKLTNSLKSSIQRLDSNSSRIELTVDVDVTILCNPAHLEQMIINILTNSLKYSPEDKKIEVHVSEHCLTIKDYGPGISKDILDRLGEPFNKGSGLEGSGLGLAWVNSICKLYDWKLKITSTDNGVAVLVDFGNRLSV